MRTIHLHFNQSLSNPNAVCNNAAAGDYFVSADKKRPDSIRRQLEVYAGSLCTSCRRIAEIHLRRSSLFEKIVAVAWHNHFAAKDDGEVRSKRFARLSEIEGRVKLRAALRNYQRKLRQEFCN